MIADRSVGFAPSGMLAPQVQDLSGVLETVGRDEPARRERVLVVDDNEQNRLVVQASLNAAGYDVETADSGRAALEAFARRPSDLVLLDVLMPEMDGFETCQLLRALPDGASTPIVFLTALSDLHTHERALEAGADDFLPKPVRRTELLIRVRSLLRLKRLSEEVRHNYEVIREQRDALLRAEKQKEQLAALLVHDLKNPLSSIALNARFITCDPSVSSKSQEAASAMINAVHAMNRMVLNLLDISRSEDGALRAHPVDVDLPALIEDVAASMQMRAAEMGLELRVSPDVPPMARFDPDLIRRVLENLIDNALRYTPPGGAVGIEAEATSEGGLELRVRDEGQGVPPEHRERIFEKYVQLEGEANVRGRAGRGLGLVFCRIALEAHGGRIWVEANALRGSVFRLWIPPQP